jgi:hypothetical protein
MPALQASRRNDPCPACSPVLTLTDSIGLGYSAPPRSTAWSAKTRRPESYGPNRQDRRAISVPVSLGMSVPAVLAGAGQGWCVVAPGDS